MLKQKRAAEGRGQRQPGGRPSQRERKVRAFRVYLDLLETGEYMRRELKAQTLSFGLTTGAFRLLEMLYREGPVSTTAAREKQRTDRRNLDRLVKALRGRGLVDRGLIEAPPAEYPETQLAKHRRGLPRHGRRVGLIRLTPAGEKFVGEVLPRHMKFVLALMRTLDWREQETLSSVCRKLREGDAVKFASEMMWEDAED